MTGDVKFKSSNFIYYWGKTAILYIDPIEIVLTKNNKKKGDFQWRLFTKQIDYV